MADPLSIVAIVGLALAGRNLSMKQETESVSAPVPTNTTQLMTATATTNPRQNDNMTTITNSLSGQASSDLGVSGVGTQLTQKTTPPNFADIVPTATADPHGMPVQDFRDRPWSCTPGAGGPFGGLSLEVLHGASENGYFSQAGVLFSDSCYRGNLLGYV